MEHEWTKNFVGGRWEYFCPRCGMMTWTPEKHKQNCRYYGLPVPFCLDDLAELDAYYEGVLDEIVAKHK
jgi:hypothetical protein